MVRKLEGDVGVRPLPREERDRDTCRLEVDEVQRKDPAVHLALHQWGIDEELWAAGPPTGHLHRLPLAAG